MKLLDRLDKLEASKSPAETSSDAGARLIGFLDAIVERHETFEDNPKESVAVRVALAFERGDTVLAMRLLSGAVGGGELAP